VDWKLETKLLQQLGYDEVLQCNFEHPLPLEVKSADVVSSLHVFEHLPRPAYSLTQIAPVLAPGGCLLAGTPTMPNLLANWRQAYFRKRLAEGQLMRGGHINSLSPGRWETLLHDSGLEAEFITGSHLVRHTGNPLEDSRLWVRFNQLWGALFPSLGSESCLLARRPVIEEDVEEWKPQSLAKSKRNQIPRIAAAAAIIMLVVGAFFHP
jgi:SAM-dependent methyltransferase